MNVNDIREGLRVDGIRRRAGTCTGRIDSTRSVPEGSPRAEVVWDDGSVRWPLVSILTPREVTP